MVFREARVADLREVARSFLEQAKDCRIWLLHGEMGSGKTTFIKVLCAELGVSDVMSSPTFSIVNEYVAAGNSKIFHFDFYRIKNEGEAYDIGTEEYFYSGNYCFIEWPSLVRDLVEGSIVEVTLKVIDETRMLKAFRRE